MVMTVVSPSGILKSDAESSDALHPLSSMEPPMASWVILTPHPSSVAAMVRSENLTASGSRRRSMKSSPGLKSRMTSSPSFCM